MTVLKVWYRLGGGRQRLFYGGTAFRATLIVRPARCLWARSGQRERARCCEPARFHQGAQKDQIVVHAGYREILWTAVVGGIVNLLLEYEMSPALQVRSLLRSQSQLTGATRGAV